MIEFIVNPASRGRRGAEIWEQVQAELQSRGLRENIDYHVTFTKVSMRADKIAAQITAQAVPGRMILAVLGGDGTLNEVLNGLDFQREIVLGYIPTGSGNDFGRSMRLPSDPQQALDAILHPGYYKKLDYGIAEVPGEGARRFIVSGGIGYDAAVCHELLYSRVRKILRQVHLEKLGYLLVGIAQIVRSKPMNGSLVIDGRQEITLENARFVSAHIHAFEGGGFCFAPTADPADGKLEVCVINHCGKWKFLLVLILSLFRKHAKMPGVQLIRCESARLRLTEAFPVHTDGESAGRQAEVAFRCSKRQIRLVTGKQPVR